MNIRNTAHSPISAANLKEAVVIGNDEEPQALDSAERVIAVASKLSQGPTYLFYSYNCGSDENSTDTLDPVGVLNPANGYRCLIWRPGAWPLLPYGLRGIRLKIRFLFRWAVHRMNLFADYGCGSLLVYDRKGLVHYSSFTPRYWRFPFIADDDFQIGDTWTHPEHRGKGLALSALRSLVAMLAKPRRRLWYVVATANHPSRRVAEKAQFRLVAEGTWIVPLRIKLAGTYVINREFPPYVDSRAKITKSMSFGQHRS
jgi:RimJ/RimL family protein N-acetyltransferase